MTPVTTTRTVLRALAGRCRRGEDGFTLVAAIAVAFIGMLLAVTVMTVAVRSEASAGKDRGRTQAVAAAEAGLDTAVLAAQQSSFTCGPTTTSVWSSPGNSSVVVTSRFFTAAGAQPCPVPSGTAITRAEITSVATYTFGSTTAKRTMGATVQLSPSGALTSKYAIFGSENVAGTSGSQSLSATNAGDVYVGTGDYSCGSGAVVEGNVIVAQGSATLVSGCRVTGSVWAAGDISLVSGAQVLGDATTWGGSISVSSFAKVGGKATVRSGTISTSSGGVIVGERKTDAALVAPPAVTLPRITYKVADWQAAGFVEGTWLKSSCSLAAGQTAVLPYLVPTVVDARSATTACGAAGLSGASGAKLLVKTDVAIFTSKITAGSSFSIGSADDLPHKVWLIVPAAATGDYCQSPSSESTMTSGFDADVDLFVYGACKVTVASGAAWRGQLWAKSIDLVSGFKMTYVPVGVPGVGVPGEAATTTSTGGAVTKSEVTS